MKKVVLAALAAFCLLLAGCGTESSSFSGSVSGDYYAEFMADDGAADGDYKITGTAHVEEALPVIYMQAEEAQDLSLYLDVEDCRGLVELVYVYGGQEDEKELQLWESEAQANLNNVELDALLAAASGVGRLEWRAQDEAELEFTLILGNADGVKYFMPISAEAEFDKLPELRGFADLKNGLYAGSAESMGKHNFTVELAAGEPDLLLSIYLEQAGELPVKAALWDLRGDVQLVYVQPDGAVQQLWDSREQDGVEQPQPWQNPWEYVLPENQDEVVTLDVSVELLPGESRLEWRTETGAAFKMNVLFEDMSMLNKEN